MKRTSAKYRQMAMFLHTRIRGTRSYQCVCQTDNKHKIIKQLLLRALHISDISDECTRRKGAEPDSGAI